MGFDQYSGINIYLGLFISGLTLQEMVGNGLLFFTAGNETTATTFSYLLYFLATNQDVQKNLHNEMTDILEERVCIFLSYSRALLSMK